MVNRNSTIRAIIFDIGGVVISSPLEPISAYERERGMPIDWLNVLINGYGNQGAWQRFERGEIDLRTFYGGFGRELSDVKQGKIWYADYCRKRNISFPQLPTEEDLRVDGRELFGLMMRGSKFDKTIVNAINILRATNRYKVISITNNFGHAAGDIEASELAFLGWDSGPASASPELKAMFDDFIDSSIVGLRKPDPAIYLLACKRNGVEPSEAVMLDDLGMNLKTAKSLGMETIQVPIGGSTEAVRKLGQLLDIDLLKKNSPVSKL